MTLVDEFRICAVVESCQDTEEGEGGGVSGSRGGPPQREGVGRRRILPDGGGEAKMAVRGRMWTVDREF